MKLYGALLFLLSLFATGSCVHRKYPEPPTDNTDHGIPLYKSIAGFLENSSGAGHIEIKENIVLSGIVIADDKSGNFYKQIIIDDGTAAIPVLLDAYNLYSRFPVGTKVYIHCKGLYTGTYYKLPLLGFPPDSKGSLQPIPFHLWDQYIVRGSTGNTIIPIEVSIADIRKAKPELYSRLITIAETQIDDTNTTQYAFPANLAAATSIILSDCDSNMIILRTSGYSTFQAYIPPKGKGSLTAIYSVYNNTPQLILRDTSDARMNDKRCF